MKRLWIPMLSLLAAGCQHAPPEEAHVGDHDEPVAIQPGESHHRNILRIAPEMLRDVRVTKAPAESRAHGEEITALGELRVNEDAYAEIGAPVPARIVSILATVGQQVAADQPLIEIASVELGKARADLLRAQAQAQVAAQAVQRKRGLAADRIVPSRELQEAEAVASAATAELQAADATLNALGASGPASAGAGLILRSPVAGTVIDRNAVRGQMADPATPLFRVADLSRLWLIAHAFERDAVRVSPGTSAQITFAALPGRTFSGLLTLVGKQVDASSRTIPLRIEVMNDGDLLRPGMSASVSVPLQETGGPIVAVPAASVQRLRDEWCVFIPQDAGTFEVRLVGRGRDLGNEVEIMNGLTAGEIVVVDGAFLLKAEAERASGDGERHDH